MPDGKLTFDTSINTSGFEDGVDEIEDHVEDLNDALDQVSTYAISALSSWSSSPSP